MKKLFLGAALAMGSLAFAQQFGVKAGANISSVSKDTWDDSKSKVGFYAGVFMNAPLATDFSIQPEVLYSQYGAKVAALGSTSTNMNLDYITVPVMFQYNATPEFYLEAGPEFGFLVSSKFKTSGNVNNTTEVDKDYFNTFNMGIGLGAGYYFTPNVGVTARYVAGLNDITNDDKWGKDASNKNGAFQVGMAYKF